MPYEPPRPDDDLLAGFGWKFFASVFLLWLLWLAFMTFV